MTNIAILGHGVVGGGVYEITRKNKDDITAKVGDEICVKRILDLRSFPDHPQPEIFTTDFNDILNDSEISIVVETMGGCNPAYSFTKAALLSGKSVVTSNKELVAAHGSELMRIAKEKGVSYMFEASVGGGIPIIRPLSVCLAANKVTEIFGILNGTTNYILTQMKDNNKDFADALSEAQAKGYAEKDPTADIEGHDAGRKICILSSLAFGKYVDFNDIDCEGITRISLDIILMAKQLGYDIKLIGHGKNTENALYCRVTPMLVGTDVPLAAAKGVFNAIMVRGDNVGDVMFYGRGAGALATASAVMADVCDIAKNSDPRLFAWGEEKAAISKQEGSEDLFVVLNKSFEVAAKAVYSDALFVYSGDLCGFVVKNADKKDITAKLTGAGEIACIIPVMQ